MSVIQNCTGAATFGNQLNVHFSMLAPRLRKILEWVVLIPFLAMAVFFSFIHFSLSIIAVLGSLAYGSPGIFLSWLIVPLFTGLDAMLRLRPVNQQIEREMTSGAGRANLKIGSISCLHIVLTLTMTPPLLSLICLFVLSCLTPSSCGDLLCAWSIWLPQLFTYFLIRAILDFSQEIRANNQTLCIRRNGTWKRVAVDDIVQVNAERKSGIEDNVYTEDETSQHILSFHNASGEKLDIDLSRFTSEANRKLFDWLDSKLDKRTFSAHARSLFGKVSFASPALPPERSDEFSLTADWQSDMDRHMARTNYVPLEPGQSLQNGRFTIERYISSGGFATAYLANTTGGDLVVLKESALPSSLSDTWRLQVSEMFAREAKLLKRCSHQYIARILDFFQENNREYLVLEHIDGTSLCQLVRRAGPLSESQVISWGLRMAGFLEYLHQLEPPIIHRDFTPENLLLHRSGEIYLIDFGAANEFIGQATGTMIGKQSYIAPEQLQGKALPQSDIYALGATLYYLLSGQEPLPLCELHPKQDGVACSEALSNLVAECTKLDPQQRIASAAALRRRLTADLGVAPSREHVSIMG